MPTSRRAVVLGGGVIGVSIAAHLQEAGVQVALVTDAELASGASGRSLSWLNSAGSRSPEYHALRMAGIDRFRTLFADDPTRGWLRFDGALHWRPAGERAEEVARHRAETRHGYQSRLLEASEVATAVPGVRIGAVPEAAIFNPGDGWVSLPHLIRHLAAELVARGGTIVTRAGRCRVAVGEDGRATAVVTEAGERYEGDTVIIACGAQTPTVAAELGVVIPDGSPLSMLVTTEPSDVRMRSVINSPRVAIRPNPDGGYALDHSWYEDDIVEVDGRARIDETLVHRLVDEASAILDTSGLKAAHWRLGRKPIPGDGAPVFGELQRVSSCFVAFTHSGATLALIAGELVAGEVVTGERHPMLETFRPERFES